MENENTHILFILPPSQFNHYVISPLTRCRDSYPLTHSLIYTHLGDKRYPCRRRRSTEPDSPKVKGQGKGQQWDLVHLQAWMPGCPRWAPKPMPEETIHSLSCTATQQTTTKTSNPLSSDRALCSPGGKWRQLQFNPPGQNSPPHSIVLRSSPSMALSSHSFLEAPRMFSFLSAGKQP